MFYPTNYKIQTMFKKNASKPAKISSCTIPYHLQVHIYQERHMEETNKTYIEYK